MIACQHSGIFGNSAVCLCDVCIPYFHCFHFPSGAHCGILDSPVASDTILANRQSTLTFESTFFFFFTFCSRGHPTAGSGSAFLPSSVQDETLSVSDYSGIVDDAIPCSHGDYPCRFTERSVRSQRVIPHRVFAPVSLLQKAQVESFMICTDSGCMLCHYVSKKMEYHGKQTISDLCKPLNVQFNHHKSPI